MYRNPAKVRELEAKVEAMRQEYNKLVDEMYQEKALVPVGYELIGAGDLVKEGALAFEPHHKHWYATGNSVGETLNEQGYVTGVTHRGYKYANPL